MAGQYYYYDDVQQQRGPVDLDSMRALFSSNHINETTICWTEGWPAWVPIGDAPGFVETLMQPPAVQPTSAVAKASYAAAREAAAAMSASRTSERAAIVAKPAAPAAAVAAVSKPAEDDPDEELRRFQQEMAQLDEDGNGDEERPGTPDEKSFTDDDGTHYVWDSTKRTFVPQGEGEVPFYDPEQMVYDAGEDNIPAPPPNRGGDDSDFDEAELEEPFEADPSTSGAVDGGGGDGGGGAGGRGNGGKGGRGRGKGGKGDKVEERKRKREDAVEREKDRAKEREDRRKEQAGWFEMKINTNVYVTGIPEDASVAEVVEVFGKCGLIKEDDARQPKVKLYVDKATGMRKGDGLITYLKEPSVDLACTILDGSQFRLGEGPRMSVTVAQFEQKGSEFVERKKTKGGSKKKKGLVNRQEDKALGWGGFDDRVDPKKSTVIMKRLFDPDELIADETLLPELEADIAQECAKFGPVDKLKVYSGNPEGVVSVRFKTEEAAAACIAKMEGRFFGGKQLGAALWDGFTNYFVKVQESAEAQQRRLEKFARELEEGGGAAAAAD